MDQSSRPAEAPNPSAEIIPFRRPAQVPTRPVPPAPVGDTDSDDDGPSAA